MRTRRANCRYSPAFVVALFIYHSAATLSLSPSAVSSREARDYSLLTSLSLPLALCARPSLCDRDAINYSQSRAISRGRVASREVAFGLRPALSMAFCLLCPRIYTYRCHCLRERENTSSGGEHVRFIMRFCDDGYQG